MGSKVFANIGFANEVDSYSVFDSSVASAPSDRSVAMGAPKSMPSTADPGVRDAPVRLGDIDCCGLSAIRLLFSGSVFPFFTLSGKPGSPSKEPLSSSRIRAS
jgi:hypothetical protein